jgi:MOSC domain-containing protein YiiM
MNHAPTTEKDKLAGKVVAVCTSKEKGTTKEPISEGQIKEEYGLEGDAHADCCTHRQVSLLAVESIDKMRKLGIELKPGDFAENLTVEGVNLLSAKSGTHIRVGKEIDLEVTQIGKECHSGCAIQKLVGKCIMPKEGIFTRVIRGGTVKPGDSVQIVGK